MLLNTLIINIGKTQFFGSQQEGTAVSSLVSDFLEKKITVGASEMEEKAIENIAYTVYGGEFFFFLQNELWNQHGISCLRYGELIAN